MKHKANYSMLFLHFPVFPHLHLYPIELVNTNNSNFPTSDFIYRSHFSPPYHQVFSNLSFDMPENIFNVFKSVPATWIPMPWIDVLTFF